MFIQLTVESSIFCFAEKCEGGDGLEWSAHLGGPAHLGPSAYKQSHCAATGNYMAVAFVLYQHISQM